MSRIAFGELVPCRFCHGHGERVLPMTPSEKRDREREKRRALRSGDVESGVLDRASSLKPCPDCSGEGYVPFGSQDR